MTSAIDETGNRYGRLLVLDRAGHLLGHPAWRCACDCGETVVERGIVLRHGRRMSCGCLKRDHRLRHGAARGGAVTPTYRAWTHMRQRCLNPNSDNFANYGGRGITIDPRWDDFERFLDDVGERPPNPPGWASRKSFWTLDRIDNDGPYTPDNVRWASPAQQRHNQRGRVSRAEYDLALRRIAELEAQLREKGQG